MAPHLKAITSKLLRYKHIVEAETENFKLVNETFGAVVYKSEVWLTGRCEGSCPGNCTNKEGADTEWSYMKKYFNPAKDDEKLLDLTLKTVCKGKVSQIQNQI